MSAFTRLMVAQILAAAVGAACAQGQEVRRAFGLVLGRTIPTGDLRASPSGEGFEDGWTAGGHLTLERPTSRLGLRLDVSYAAHGGNDQLKTDLSNALGAPSDETLTLIGAGAAVVYRMLPDARVVPSVFSGFGLWFVSIGVTSYGSTSHHSALKPGWQLGAELRYRAIFLDARYVAVAALGGFPRATFFPIALGIRLGKGSRT